MQIKQKIYIEKLQQSKTITSSQTSTTGEPRKGHHGVEKWSHSRDRHLSPRDKFTQHLLSLRDHCPPPFTRCAATLPINVARGKRFLSQRYSHVSL